MKPKWIVEHLADKILQTEKASELALKDWEDSTPK